MPDAFITGGTGFVGGAVLRHLVASGRTVRALVRSDEGRAAVEALGAEAVGGDVLDAEALERAARGARVVYHVAGVNELCSRRPDHLYRVNVDGAVNAVRATAAVGAERIVLTSSTAAIGEPKGVTADEGTPHSGRHVSDYARSKAHGEQAAMQEAERIGVDLVAVNPASVQGPGRIGGTARLILAYLRGEMRVAVDAAVSLVFVDDCALGHRLAADRGVPGERYILSGVTFSLREAFEQLEVASGVSHRVWYLPSWSAVAAGAVMGPLARLAGRRPALCLEAGRAVVHGHRYDGSRAERDLGLTYTPIDEALRRTVDWYRGQGLV